jgi:cyclophilin family peptidyl-prolyl cis-trans isomerase
MTRSLTILAALVVSTALFAAGCSTGGGGSSKPSADAFGSAPASAAPASAAPASAAPASATPSSAPAGSGSASGSCPTAPPAAMAAGTKRVVTIETAKGKIEITVEADLGPLAAGNFVALASCGFYNGLVFHRLVPGFVIQGGDPTGTGSGGPGYSFADDPVTVPYARGVVAMANSGPATNGSQFFIVLADAGLDPNYSIFGRVTSGMEAVDAIAAMPNAGSPTNAALTPVAMDKVTVSP